MHLFLFGLLLNLNLIEATLGRSIKIVYLFYYLILLLP